MRSAGNAPANQAGTVPALRAVPASEADVFVARQQRRGCAGATTIESAAEAFTGLRATRTWGTGPACRTPIPRISRTGRSWTAHSFSP